MKGSDESMKGRARRWRREEAKRERERKEDKWRIIRVTVI